MRPIQGRIVAGTATLGRLNRQGAIVDMLAAFASRDIRHLDTAPLYGAGCMERIIGRACTRFPEFVVNTKFGLSPPVTLPGLRSLYLTSKIAQKIASTLARRKVTRTDARDCLRTARRSLENSLRLLGDRIDVFMAHEIPAAALEDDGFLGFVQQAKSAGKFRRFGFAGYREQIAPATRETLWEHLDVLQVESRFGTPPPLPDGWAGELFLHGVLAPLRTDATGDGDVAGRIRALVTDALATQGAHRIVVGFSRHASLRGFLEAISAPHTHETTP